jgi:hypothetical protein
MKKWRSCAALLPTPTARDWKDGTAQSCQNVEPNGLLGRVVHLLPTPRACSGLRSSGMNRSELTTQQGVPGSLNPAWVEWLMGFPEGWTDLGPSATPSSRKSSKKSAAQLLRNKSDDQKTLTTEIKS